MRVRSEFELFDQDIPSRAVVPSDQSCLEATLELSLREFGDLTECIHLYSTHGRNIYLHTDRNLALSMPGQPWCFEVEDVVRISWRGGECELQCSLGSEGSERLLVFWFVHIFLPLYLTLERGYDFIHSAAVEVDEHPILFVAPSTGGKSTLGDYFLKQGHPMLSDDKVATFLHENQFWAVPSHPHHRPFREFEVLGYPVENFSRSSAPIRAFYALEQGEPDSDVDITEVTGFRKFEQLLPNYLFGFDFLKQQRMRWLAQLADQSRVYRIRRPWSLERMHEVYEAICTHSRALGSGPQIDTKSQTN